MMNQALEKLAHVWGYRTFRPNQESIIAQLLDGGDALVLMPTGGGKSLCYQLPALLRDGVGLVISPLIALMEDQVTALQQLGVRAAYWNSSLSPAEASAVRRQLLGHELDLLYVAPERLLRPEFLAMLDTVAKALIAIDESHCVSRWGHDFRPEYMQLSILHQRWPEVPRIALTATAEPMTRREIVEQLNLHQARQFIASFDRPNIRYSIGPKQHPKQQLLQFLESEHADDSGIVYCLSRRSTEETADWLNARGFDALPYHAGLAADQRRAHQRRFLDSRVKIIVATIAFGMGIDKPDVRFVAHLDLPKSIEAYYQETGRAGRDGDPANAWMVYGLSDVALLRQFIVNSEADAPRKRIEHHKLDQLLGLCESTTCRRRQLLRYFGQTMDQDCGNCDACLNPVETYDGTQLAQKVMSVVYRVDQRFGSGHVIDVLRGVATEKVTRFGHDALTSFGCGADLTVKQWRSVIRQLVAANLLQVNLNQYHALQLTSLSRPVLVGEQQVRLRQDPKQARQPRRSRKTAACDDRALTESEQRLFEQLRTLRRDLAEAQSVPPYVVFADRTLREMAIHRPGTEQQMQAIHGVGDRKMQRYGRLFLQRIAEYSD